MTLYDEVQYGGRSLVISQQNADLKNDQFDNRAESAEIRGSCSWLMYADANFLGGSYLLTSDGDFQGYPDSSSWGDSGEGNTISSARALPPAGTTAIALFQHIHFEGRMVTLYDSERDFPKIDFNDQLSSFIITGGDWTLYQHINFEGTRSTFSGASTYQNLPQGVANDDISSVEKL